MHLLVCLLLLHANLATQPAPADGVAPATFVAIVPPPGATSIFPTQVSGDGRVVTLYLSDGDNRSVACRWTAAEGLVLLEDFGNPTGPFVVRSISADGTRLFGQHQSRLSEWRDGRFEPMAFDRAADGLIREGGEVTVSAISSDGTTIVGREQVVEDVPEGHFITSSHANAFLVREGVVIHLQEDDDNNPLRGNPSSVSADGSTVVGNLDASPFRWTRVGGLQRLKETLQDRCGSVARQVSADGSTVVGVNYNREGAASTQAWIWRDQGGVQWLDGVGAQLQILDVSGDGSIIVGSFEHKPVVWTADGKRRPLQAVLDAHGIGHVLADWRRISLRRISDDARVLVGAGYAPNDQRAAFVFTFEDDIANQ
jgi:uncharacterized membrane protein